MFVLDKSLLVASELIAGFITFYRVATQLGRLVQLDANSRWPMQPNAPELYKSAIPARKSLESICILIILCFPIHLLPIHLAPYTPSKDTARLIEKRTNMKTYGARAFDAYTPHLWNRLPSYIRQASSVTDFKNLQVE